MRVSSSPYELVARADGRRRRGSLLRVEFDDGIVGYGDLHPWIELGDEPLSVQLEGLTKISSFASTEVRVGEKGTAETSVVTFQPESELVGSWSPSSQSTWGATPSHPSADPPSPPEGRRGSDQAAQSLQLARADAEARAENRPLFDDLTIPVSHASLPFEHSQVELEAAVRAGFTHVKLKSWEFDRDEVRLFRESGLRFRLDFNAQLEFGEVQKLVGRWGDLSWIDWIEDPCPYDAFQWNRLQEQFGVRLALDFEQADVAMAFDVFVLKPARASQIPEGVPFAVTSYLDHPVGQLGAAWTAALLNPPEICGLVTHEVYEPTVFSRQLRVENGRLIPPGGPGLGFAHELESLEWSPL